MELDKRSQPSVRLAARRLTGALVGLLHQWREPLHERSCDT
jgi:hypothetical protein